MTFHQAELKEAIKLGESSKLEFKEDMVRNSRLVQEICAFANFRGGVILLGVADDGRVVGLTRKDNEERVINTCLASIEPKLVPSIEYFQLDQKKILVIRIEAGMEKPYAVVKNGKRHYYMRVGSTSRISSPGELRQMFQDSGKLHPEFLPTLAEYRSLSQRLLLEYFHTYRGIQLARLHEEEIKRVLINSSLLLESGNATLIGCLLFCQNPIPYYGGAGISFAVIDGNQVTDPLIELAQFKSTLFENFQDFLRCFHAYNHPQSIQFLENGIRQEVHNYPIRVVREIVTNAIIHRDYSIKGSQIRVFLYRDYLEVRSPGTLPDSLTVEKIKMGITYYRNPMLMGYFYEQGLIERLGRGIRMAFQVMKEHNQTEPEILEEGGELVVRIWK